MRKLLALLLAIVMVFALCACGNNNDDDEDDDQKGSQVQDDDDKKKDDDEDDKKKDDEEDEDESIVGKWEGKIDLADAVENIFAATEPDWDEDYVDALLALYEDIDLEIVLEFDEDGEAAFRPSNASVTKALAAKATDNPDLLVDFLKAKCAYLGMDEDDFEDEEGMSIEEFVENLIEDDELEDYMGATEDTEDTAEYKLKGDTLTLSYEDDYTESFTVTLKGNKLTLADYEANGESNIVVSAFLNGLTFKRK